MIIMIGRCVWWHVPIIWVNYNDLAACNSPRMVWTPLNQVKGRTFQADEPLLSPLNLLQSRVTNPQIVIIVTIQSIYIYIDIDINTYIYSNLGGLLVSGMGWGTAGVVANQSKSFKMLQGLGLMSLFGDLFHITLSHICWRWNIPSTVGWCFNITGHRNQPLCFQFEDFQFSKAPLSSELEMPRTAFRMERFVPSKATRWGRGRVWGMGIVDSPLKMEQSIWYSLVA